MPFIGPIDVRYNRFARMAVGEREEDLAKRFFTLLHLFLARNWEAPS